MGIALSNISKDEEQQLSLFVDEEKEKQKKVDAAMDSIRSKYGMGKIMRGSVMKNSMNIGKKFNT